MFTQQKTKENNRPLQMEQLEAREVFSLGSLGCLLGPWVPALNRDTSNLASSANISHQQPTTTAKVVKTIEGTNLHDKITITPNRTAPTTTVDVKIQSYWDTGYNHLFNTQQYSLTNNKDDFYGLLLVNGHNGNDIIDVSQRVNWKRVKFDTLIRGGRGNDKIYGSSGNNEIHGGDGNDWIYGGTRSDTIHGGHGNDKIYGRSGDDELKGDFGDDQIWGNNGNDKIYGGTGHDRLYGGRHKDTIYGDPDQPYSDAHVQLANKLGKKPSDLWPAQFTIYGNDVIEGGSGDDHSLWRSRQRHD